MFAISNYVPLLILSSACILLHVNPEFPCITIKTVGSVDTTSNTTVSVKTALQNNSVIQHAPPLGQDVFVLWCSIFQRGSEHRGY